MGRGDGPERAPRGGDQRQAAAGESRGPCDEGRRDAEQAIQAKSGSVERIRVPLLSEQATHGLAENRIWENVLSFSPHADSPETLSGARRSILRACPSGVCPQSRHLPRPVRSPFKISFIVR